jgi:hypothetical protein
MTMGSLLIAPLFFVVAWILVRELRKANVRTLVAESFALQHVELDGHSIPASTLDVIHRWSPSGGVDLYGRQGLDSATFTVNWLCRTADRSYLLAIAQGGRGPDGEINIGWVWRRLTEERARHSLIGNRRVYRAAFGSDP